MFKKILLGTFWGYICASVFLILYRFFFGGGSRFLDGDFTRYDFSTILPSFFGYFFVNLLFSLFTIVVYTLVYKIFSVFKKNKKSFSKEIIYYCGSYTFLIITVMELTDFSPILNIIFVLFLPIILNIIYFYFKYKIHDN